LRVSADTLLRAIDDRGIATLMLNRPHKANAYDPVMLDAIGAQLENWHDNPAVRAVVLRGAGKHFSAGAAVGEAHGTATGTPPRRLRNTVEVCLTLDALPKPTIAVVQGACIGGAVALVSCCDCVIVATDASFGLPELRLGFAPGPLVPFFVRAMGTRALRHHLLTGERFWAAEALRIGLVHEICDRAMLDTLAEQIVDEYLKAAPGALAQTKNELRGHATLPDPEWFADKQAAFDAATQSAEAAEGRASFREKRNPNWYKSS
jgi:methylglutaconyl-CoA hydratase